jgi:hypothetical protein
MHMDGDWGEDAPTDPFGDFENGPDYHSRWDPPPEPDAGWVPRRWTRLRERWEADTEPFEGAFAVEDLACCGKNLAASERVVGRYFAVRVVLRAARSRGLHTLEAERRAAAAYVRLSAYPRDAEAYRLTALVRLASPEPCEVLFDLLLAAGDDAVANVFPCGAHSLYLAAYEISRRHSKNACAAKAAHALSILSASEGGVWSPRLWRRRAYVLGRRSELADG